MVCRLLKALNISLSLSLSLSDPVSYVSLPIEFIRSHKAHKRPIKSIAVLPSTDDSLEVLTASMDHRIGHWSVTLPNKPKASAKATLEYEYVGHTASVESIAVNGNATKVCAVISSNNQPP
jgi:hypothetical protein